MDKNDAELMRETISLLETAFVFPAPENAKKTQIAGTLPTYKKARAHLDMVIPNGKTIDIGSGLGLGAEELGADSFEPFPCENVKPTYTDFKSIPDNSYHRVTSFNVLNVVPPDVRRDIVQNIGRILAPNGVALITTRGRDVKDIAKGSTGPEQMSVVTSKNTYQKGFTTKELMNYVSDVLGEGFDVAPLKLGKAGVIVKKLSTLDDQPIDEAAVGLGAMMMSKFTKPFSPSAEFKYYTGVLSNSLYNSWRKVARKDSTAQDLVEWFEKALTNENIAGSQVGKFADVQKAVEFIVQKSIGTHDFSVKLTDTQTKKIFAEVGAACGRRMQNVSMKLLHSGTKDQQERTLTLLSKIRPFITSSATASSLSLSKVAGWLIKNGDLKSNNKQTAIKNGFVNYVKTVKSGSVGGSSIPILPQNFLPTNNKAIKSTDELSNFIEQLDNILLSVIMADDVQQHIDGDSNISTQTTTPTPPPQSTTNMNDLKKSVSDWMKIGYDIGILLTMGGM
jgi:hypothetical protein